MEGRKNGWEGVKRKQVIFLFFPQHEVGSPVSSIQTTDARAGGGQDTILFNKVILSLCRLWVKEVEVVFDFII